MPNENTTAKKFTAALATFVTAIKQSMDAAKECSIMAIEHYAEHDNLNWCQKFYDAMPKNFTRKAAYVKWLAAHAPILLADGKFTKDKAENAVKFDISGAKEKAFWDYAPDNEAVLLTDADAFARLMVAVRYFRKDKVKTSERVKALVNDVEKLVDVAKLQAEQSPVIGEPEAICDDENAVEATA